MRIRCSQASTAACGAQPGFGPCCLHTAAATAVAPLCEGQGVRWCVGRPSVGGGFGLEVATPSRATTGTGTGTLARRLCPVGDRRWGLPGLTTRAAQHPAWRRAKSQSRSIGATGATQRLTAFHRTVHLYSMTTRRGRLSCPRAPMHTSRYAMDVLGPCHRLLSVVRRRAAPSTLRKWCAIFRDGLPLPRVRIRMYVARIPAYLTSSAAAFGVDRMLTDALGAVAVYTGELLRLRSRYTRRSRSAESLRR